MSGCFCVQGCVAPAGGEGVDQFVSGVSGTQGGTVVLSWVPDGNRCMFTTTCKRPRQGVHVIHG